MARTSFGYNGLVTFTKVHPPPLSAKRHVWLANHPGYPWFSQALARGMRPGQIAESLVPAGSLVATSVTTEVQVRSWSEVQLHILLSDTLEMNDSAASMALVSKHWR